MSGKRVHTEEFAIDGSLLVAKVKELLQAGKVRRITIKNEEGKALIEIPLTVGLVVGLLAPVLAALGALAALSTRCIIAVERLNEDEQAPGQSPPGD
ncbi:DUF4342 domain-containing protein [bacterium]|nr:DUF4342 domain-containing protein [bacterium]